MVNRLNVVAGGILSQTLLVVLLLSLPLLLQSPSLASAAATGSKSAESSPPGSPQERVAVLPFWVFDQQGNVVPQASETELARLSTLMPRAIAARLVQVGKFEVLDNSILESRDAVPSPGAHELDRVEQLLARGDAEQVITGAIAQIQQSVVVSIQRFAMGPDGPTLEGAATARATSAGEAITLVETLLTQVYPPDADVVPRPIARIVVVPSILRIPVGGAAPIQAYALDDLGRPLASVPLVFQSSDESHVSVDERGNVTGIRPGSAQITLQPIGRSLAQGANLPTIDVTVTGPSLGLRAGVSMSGGESGLPRVGLRLTPGHEIRTAPSTQSLPQAGANPMNFLTSFFAALIGNQMLTMDLDFIPEHDISLSLSAVQRTASSYFGTGLGVAVPMSDNATSGVLLRLTLGGQVPYRVRSNITLPVEVNVDFIIGSSQSAPKARIGVSAGIDLFQ